MMRRYENNLMKAVLSGCKEPAPKSRYNITSAVRRLCGTIGENGGAYTVFAKKPVISKFIHDLTEFEVSENEIRIQDHIGKCTAGEALFFISEFQKYIAKKFPDTTFVIDHYVDDLGYYGIRLHKYRPGEGYWQPPELNVSQPAGKIIFAGNNETPHIC